MIYLNSENFVLQQEQHQFLIPYLVLWHMNGKNGNQRAKDCHSIMYTLCYGLSQLCNWMQTDNAIFLHQSNLNQDGLDTVRQMGGSCSRRVANNLINNLAKSHQNKVSEIIHQAIEYQ